MSNLHPNSFAGEGSTHLPHSDSFHNNRSFFNGKDALHISIRSLAYSAPGAVRATEVLPCSKIRPDFRSLSLNRSNLQPIYHQHPVNCGILRCKSWNEMGGMVKNL